jgi:hypothetical protein
LEEFLENQLVVVVILERQEEVLLEAWEVLERV